MRSPSEFDTLSEDGRSEHLALVVIVDTDTHARRPEGRPIEVHITDLRQLFNAMDPAPFRDRDLDPKAEEFIVGWASELPREASLALLIHLDAGPTTEGEEQVVRD